jgi:hypothetical protein
MIFRITCLCSVGPDESANTQTIQNAIFKSLLIFLTAWTGVHVPIGTAIAVSPLTERIFKSGPTSEK